MSSGPHIENNYLPESYYADYPPDGEGFARFQHPENSQYYFAWFALGELVLRSEGYTNENARDKGVESVRTNKDDNDNYKVVMQPDGKWVLELLAPNNKEIARSRRFDSKEEARRYLPEALAIRAATAHKLPEAHHEDNYLACHEYADRDTSEVHPRFSAFEKDGEYYFALLDNKNDVVLRGEGYTTSAARDHGIQSVIKNLENPDRYKVEEQHGYHFLMLRAGNNREIARGCPLDEAGARALLAVLVSGGFLNIPSEPAHEDNYLACKEYRDHQRSDAHKQFSTFEKDGEHYFALLDKDDDVALRSEGYTTEVARNKGIESVVANMETRERYEVEEHLGYHFVILRAANNKEIARSCPLSEAAALALIGVLTGAAALAAPATAAAAAATAPVTTVTAATPARRGGWWWWLLLVLLLVVLFLLWRGCSGADGADGADGGVATVPTEETAPAGTPIYAADHDCSWIPILFDFDSDEIDSSGMVQVAGVVDELNNNPSYRGLFIGFSDNVGTEEYNIDLSLRRARAVRSAAMAMGIDSTRISTSELDEHNPIASNRTEAGRKYNRRVVMYVFNTDNHLVCRQQEIEVPGEVRE